MKIQNSCLTILLALTGTMISCNKYKAENLDEQSKLQAAQIIDDVLDPEDPTDPANPPETDPSTPSPDDDGGSITPPDDEDDGVTDTDSDGDTGTPDDESDDDTGLPPVPPVPPGGTPPAPPICKAESSPLPSGQVCEVHTVKERPRIRNLHESAAAAYCEQFYHASVQWIDRDTRHNQTFTKFIDGKWVASELKQEKEIEWIECGPINICTQLPPGTDPVPTPECPVPPVTPPSPPTCQDQFVLEVPSIRNLHADAAGDYCREIHHAAVAWVDKQTRHDQKLTRWKSGAWVQDFFKQDQEIERIKCGPIRVCSQ